MQNHNNSNKMNTSGKPSMSMLQTPTFVALNTNQNHNNNNILHNLNQTSFFTNPHFFTQNSHLFSQPSPQHHSANAGANQFSSITNFLPYGLPNNIFTQHNPQMGQQSNNNNNNANNQTLLFTSPVSSSFSPINLANLAASLSGKAITSNVATPPTSTNSSGGLNLTTVPVNSNQLHKLPIQNSAVPILLPNQQNLNLASNNNAKNFIPQVRPQTTPTPAILTNINSPAQIKNEDVKPLVKLEHPEEPVKESEPEPSVKLGDNSKPEPAKHTPNHSSKASAMNHDDESEIEKYPDSLLEKNEFFKTKVLECIDKLKERKARPDMDRIGCLMKRQFNIPHKITHKCLDRLAEVGSVVCVDYKGHISYRNPSKWRRTSMSNGVTNPTHISKLLIDSVKHLCEKHNAETVDENGEAKKPPTAFTLTEIETMLLLTEKIPVETTEEMPADEYNERRRAFYDQFMPSLRLCVEREVLTGGLSKNQDGKYILDESGDKKRAYAALLFNKKAIPRSMLNKPKTTSQKQAIFNGSNGEIKAQPLHSTIVTSSVGLNMNMKPIASRPANCPTNPSSNVLLTNSNGEAVKIPVPGNKRGRPASKFKKNMDSNENKIKPILPNNNGQNSTVYTTLSFNQGSVYPATIFPKTQTIQQQPIVNNGSNDTKQQQQQQSSSQQQQQQVRPICPSYTPSGNEKCFKCSESFSSQDPFTALQCQDCKQVAHTECLDFWPELSKRATECGWQCLNCKKCIICKTKTDESNQLKICDMCDQGFHEKCLEKKADPKDDPNSAWVCSFCSNAGFTLTVTPQPPPSPPKTPIGEEKKIDSCGSDKENTVQPLISQPVNATIPESNLTQKRRASNPLSPSSQRENTMTYPSPSKITKISSPLKETPQPFIKLEEKKVEEKPVAEERPEEVKNWSVTHVKSWLQEQGYNKEAESFSNEEIDGACLLLMKKMDILTDLGIKLGPAVKIFEKIKSLQSTSWMSAR